jgi:hypothetical protein
MNNLPKNSFSRAKQSMIENLQNNNELQTDSDIEAGNEQNSPKNNSNESVIGGVEQQSDKLQENEPKQKNQSKIKPAAKQPEKTLSMPTAKKTLALPMIYEFAVKELKARRNFAKQLRGEKGMETEEDIFVEIFRLFFSQPGESSDCLRVAQERMDLLLKGSNY